MHVRRLDLGTDVVYLPQRGLLILHPNLNYGQSLAAVSSVLPNLPYDSVMNLVAQVTPRPERNPRRHRLVPAGLLAALAVLTGILTIQPAQAEVEPYGKTWRTAAHTLDLACDPEGKRVRTCHGPQADYTVTRFGSDQMLTYVLTPSKHSVTRPVYVVCFADPLRLQEFVDSTPATELIAGRAAIW